MAFPTICPECLADDHKNCEASFELERARVEKIAEETGEFIVGGPFCVCGHGEPENAFQKSVRDRSGT